ncbi:hypothetical protein BV25DRAFT_1838070 [Artomyces pyxidatus]|uniref:Uncharacterized protein n=1 Tax=Artomyces pyxidatus TaxID=48021 RepID=A0ACB8T4E9_9AGAM|nr:hypothetical protein BV25DRAFT_1838070 [Artomyces pyxidatus]
MLTNVLSLSLALLPIVQGAVLPKRAAAVSCETVLTGTLAAFTTDGTLPTTGANVSLHFTSEATAFLSTDGADVLFNFQSCNSTFMGYEGKHFGHIVPVSELDACLSAALGASAGPPFLVLNDECSYTDDDSQLMQYWHFAQDNELLFVGETKVSAQANHTAPYTLVLDPFFGEQAIRVAPSGTSNDTVVSLAIVPITVA